MIDERRSWPPSHTLAAPAFGEAFNERGGYQLLAFEARVEAVGEE
jgi:hypothetical protein